MKRTRIETGDVLSSQEENCDRKRQKQTADQTALGFYRFIPRAVVKTIQSCTTILKAAFGKVVDQRSNSTASPDGDDTHKMANDSAAPAAEAPLESNPFTTLPRELIEKIVTCTALLEEKKKGVSYIHPADMGRAKWLKELNIPPADALITSRTELKLRAVCREFRDTFPESHIEFKWRKLKFQQLIRFWNRHYAEKYPEEYQKSSCERRADFGGWLPAVNAKTTHR